MSQQYLEKALELGKLPNTLLLAEKKTALWLASKLLKAKTVETHPDFHPLIPDGLHSIESIRSAIDISHRAPYSAPAKVFLIEAAEKMQPAAANALLKTLEEPHLDSYWILVSQKPQEILPTILSRCAKPRSTSQNGEPTTTEFQEAKKLLHYLIEEKPSYPLLFQTLEKINALMEEKDPAPLFIALAEGYLSLERKGPLGPWQEAFEEARLGVERNIKLSTCLEFFFLKAQ